MDRAVSMVAAGGRQALGDRAPVITVSIFEPELVSGGVRRKISSPIGATSRFVDADQRLNTPEFRYLAVEDRFIVVGEASIPYRPRLLSAIPFVWDLTGASLYEFVIF